MTNQTGVYRLILLRHAKAEPQSLGADHERALALRGRTQARTLGQYLSQQSHLRLDVALCSTALRTRQTWSLVQSQLPYQINTLERDELYEARVGEVVAQLNTLPDAARTAIVIGHEPTMSSAARILAQTGEDAELLEEINWGIPTSTMCVLQSSKPFSGWEARSAQLVEVWRPQD